MIEFKQFYNKMFLNDIRRAIEHYNMIENGDKVAVGLSGGKDSIVLLFALYILKNYSYMNFELYGINIDLGLDMNIEPLANYCKKSNINFISEKTNIAKVVFEDRNEKNPCSLCSKLRKGALVRVANSIGVNKIALGHNSDDVIETLFMNVLYTGKLGTFHPCKTIDNKDIVSIRPMIYLKEMTVKKVASIEQLPVIKNNCPVDGDTKREYMKNMLSSLEEDFPDAQKKILTSLQNIDTKNMWKQK